MEADQVDAREARDTESLLTTFPAEIWGIILKQVTDMKVAANLCLASQFFVNQLQIDRMDYLFALVWPLLAKNYEEELVKDFTGLSHGQRFTAKGQCATCGNGTYPKAFSGLLRLRLLSPVWCRIVDEFYEKHPKRLAISNNIFPTHPIYAQRRVEELTFWQRAESGNEDQHYWQNDFNKHFKATHGALECQRSPFMWRAFRVWLRALTPQEHDDLVKYGRHIAHCAFRIVDAHDPNLFRHLRQTLALMPNLETLSISCRINQKSLRTPQQEPAFFRRELMVDRDPEAMVMPTLPKLEFFKGINLHPIYFDAIILANPHVKMLKIEKHDSRNFESRYISTIPGECALQAFHYDLKTAQDWNDLFSVQSVWRMKQASLHFHPEVALDYKVVLDYVNEKWGSTLNELVIRLPFRRHNVIEDDASLAMNLPELKSLKLRMFNYRSLDFLLPTNDKLEYLFIGVRFNNWGRQELERLQNQENPDLDEILRMNGNPIDNEIWRTFRRLKTVEIELFFAVKGERFYGILHRHQRREQRVWKRINTPFLLDL